MHHQRTVSEHSVGCSKDRHWYKRRWRASLQEMKIKYAFMNILNMWMWMYRKKKILQGQLEFQLEEHQFVPSLTPFRLPNSQTGPSNTTTGTMQIKIDSLSYQINEKGENNNEVSERKLTSSRHKALTGYLEVDDIAQLRSSEIHCMLRSMRG